MPDAPGSAPGKRELAGFSRNPNGNPNLSSANKAHCSLEETRVVDDDMPDRSLGRRAGNAAVRRQTNTIGCTRLWVHSLPGSNRPLVHVPGVAEVLQGC